MTQNSQPADNQNSGDSKFSFSSPGWRQLAWIFVIILFSSYWLGQAQMSHYETLSYSQFKERIRNNEIARVTLKGQTVTGIFKTDNAQPEVQETRPVNAFFTTLPAADDPELIALLEAHQVDISAETTQASSWQTALVSFLPLLLIFGFFYYSSRTLRKRLGGGDFGVFNYGKSKARRFRKGSIDLSFADVAGLENAKRDLHEIIDFLKQPEDYRWSSIHAHLEGKDDELVKVAPLLDLIPDWSSFLATSTEEELNLLHRHERTGRPLGDLGFVETLEQILGRTLQPQKPGPKKKDAGD